MAALDQNTLNGNFKDQYGKGPVLVYDPQWKLQLMIPFNPGQNDATGNYFIELVQTALSFGLTKGGTTATAYDLASGIPGQTEPAKIRGNQMTAREQIALGVITRAQTSKQAFLESTKYKVIFLNTSAKQALELALMHGQYGLARIATSANASATSTVLTVTSGHWSTGIWAGAEGMPLQMFIGNGASPTLVTGGGVSEFYIDTVDNTAKTLTVTSTTAALITAIDAAVLANPSAVNLYYRVEGSTTNEMAGLHYISGKTTGTLFDISCDDWSVWRGNNYDSAGVFTFDKLQDAISQIAARGTMGDFQLFCNVRTWASLAKQNNALRVLDSSYDKSKINRGSRSIEYFSAEGTVTIDSHLYCKEGFAYLFKKDIFKRIGSCDIIFNNPLNDQQFFFDLVNANGVEMRAFTDQSLFTSELRGACLISGITY